MKPQRLGHVQHASSPVLAALVSAAEPWEKPAGDLRVQLRYPAWLLREAAIKCCLQPRPVHLVGSASDVVAAALAAGSVAGMLNHRREADEMAAEQLAAAASSAAVGDDADASHEAGSGHSSPRSESSDSSRSRSAGPMVVCLVAPQGATAPSPAAAAMLRALRRRVPGLETAVVANSCLLDDEWLALGQADAILVDWPAASGDTAPGAAPGVSAAPLTGQAEEAAIAAAHLQLEAAGLLELLWQRFWGGCLLVGVGQGCALLGRRPAGICCASATALAPPVLPWYRLRAGGRSGGWATLHASLSACPEGGCAAASDSSGGCIAAGLLGGGAWVADPITGHADMLVAPSRDALVALAAWSSQLGHQPEEVGLEEAAEEHGFMVELARV